MVLHSQPIDFKTPYSHISFRTSTVQYNTPGSFTTEEIGSGKGENIFSLSSFGLIYVQGSGSRWGRKKGLIYSTVLTGRQ